jgi:hypothetical protein
MIFSTAERGRKKATSTRSALKSEGLRAEPVSYYSVGEGRCNVRADSLVSRLYVKSGRSCQ